MTINIHDCASLLRKSLIANALFSGACGLAMLLLESNVTGWLGVSGLSISPLGMMLLAFSIALVALSFARRVPVIFVRAIIAADLAWVLGSAVLLVMYPALLSTTGTLLVIDVALVVLVFAVIQAVGLRRAMRAFPGSNGASRVATR